MNKNDLPPHSEVHIPVLEDIVAPGNRPSEPAVRDSEARTNDRIETAIEAIIDESVNRAVEVASEQLRQTLSEELRQKLKPELENILKHSNK